MQWGGLRTGWITWSAGHLILRVAAAGTGAVTVDSSESSSDWIIGDVWLRNSGARTLCTFSWPQPLPVAVYGDGRCHGSVPLWGL